MGADPSHGPDDGGVSAQGGPSYNWKSTMVAPGRKLGIPPSEEAIRESGLEEVEEYVLRRHDMAT